MTDLQSFIVHERLTVGNLKIEPNRVSADYIITTFSGDKRSTPLTYTYNHPYFQADSEADQNLASMMLAQLAFNYGLFFREIVFEGLFDQADRQFIRDMTENTSREIVTNKLMIDNVFLLPPYNEIQVSKQEKYTAASIVFANKSEYNSTGESIQADPDKYAILSSGGKDSLLTYGLIKEIGIPYPVFINESGRHWFTAVNSHRYYNSIEPNTAKPWCNSDRVFNWMLRQLPFIRPDFADVRADIYPIRLWTVAVFLFGVLPIVRKKGIGNILIGNEYDTTIFTHTDGIPHYQGLYDQSKYFDNALTAYYRRKGWNINQYSILRSLSEMLIMKVLIKRYPELQQHQVSCHAAHEKDGRMYPCGNCEKCRRIIGMIKSMDEDPAPCGYDENMVKKGLAALEKRSVKQLGSDASHLYYMLAAKKLIAANEHTSRLAKPHPEIMKLRFDKERSNLEDLPEKIRKPLFTILTQYADGAVVRDQHKWKEITVDDDFLSSVNYKYDKQVKGH